MKHEWTIGDEAWVLEAGRGYTRVTIQEFLPDGVWIETSSGYQMRVYSDELETYDEMVKEIKKRNGGI